MTRYAMVADLERCVGCQTCTASCRHANATSPAVQWRKVLDLEVGSYPNVSRVFIPVGCQHCEDPPCMHVCPTTATRKRADGIVTVDYDICIGCAYCEMACPYQARFKIESRHFAYGETAMQNESARDDPRRIGVSQKCTFCSDRIDAGLAAGLVPGLDPDATPACVNSCIADALHFGDLHDPESNVSKLLREQSHFRMHEELCTEPGFYYLHDKRHARPSFSEALGKDSTDSATAASAGGKGVEPSHQRHWDWKAATNFMCGGAGAGLFAFVALSGAAGGLSVGLGLVSVGVVAFGLFMLLFKIGRPLRFLYVLRQPQRSWMSREAWIAAVFFPLAMLSLGLASSALAISAALFGLLFLFAQAMILKESKGIPAWRSPRIVPLIVVTGVAEGAGLFVLANALVPALAALSIAAAVLAALTALRHVLWSTYVRGLQVEGVPCRTLEVLEHYSRRFFTLGFAVPMVLLTSGFILQDVARALFAIAGVLVFASGWVLKFILVTRAAYNEGFAIERIRGHGSGIATAVVKPGWTFTSARGFGARPRTTAAPFDATS